MRYLALGMALMGTSVTAEVPRVAVDIAPVHSIVAAVMGDLGTPALIVPPGGSPHDQALRPSQAAALDRADLVVWMGNALTPWLEGPMDSLAGDAVVLDLLDHPETQVLKVRTGASFAAHEEDQSEEEDRDEMDGVDQHAWLDPANAVVWAGVISAALAEIDPENAGVYSGNALEFVRSIRILEGEIEKTLAPVKGRPFVVFHDAYHYFERRFDIEAVGAVSSNDAVAPSAARLAGLRDEIASYEAVCALTEPQFNPAILDALGAARLGEVDPIGVSLTPGPDLYPQLLRNMAASLADCLD